MPQPAPTTASPAEAPHAQSIGLQLRRIVAQLVTAVDHRVVALGLTDAQWRPLVHLRQHSPLTASELAQACGLDAGGLTRLVDRLQTKGLCTRERSESDRRVVHIALTAQGARVAAKLPAVLLAVREELTRGFSAREQAVLHQLLDRLEANATALATSTEITCQKRA